MTGVIPISTIVGSGGHTGGPAAAPFRTHTVARGLPCTGQTLLSRWPLVQSPDPAEALRSVGARMSRAGVRGIEALSSSQPGTYWLNGFADQDFAVGFISTDMGLKANVSTGREPSYFLHFGVFGELHLEVGKRQLRNTRSVAAVVNPGERLLVLLEPPIATAS